MWAPIAAGAVGTVAGVLKRSLSNRRSGDLDERAGSGPLSPESPAAQRQASARNTPRGKQTTPGLSPAASGELGRAASGEVTAGQRLQTPRSFCIRHSSSGGSDDEPDARKQSSRGDGSHSDTSPDQATGTLGSSNMLRSPRVNQTDLDGLQRSGTDVRLATVQESGEGGDGDYGSPRTASFLQARNAAGNRAMTLPHNNVANVGASGFTAASSRFGPGSGGGGGGSSGGGSGNEADPALLGVQDKIIKLTREQTIERMGVLTSLKEEQRRLAAIRKEITETELANTELKKALGRTDLKKLREQKEALAAQAAEAEQLAAHIAALGSTATRLEALKAERARLEPLTGEVAVLEEQLKELRQLESTKAALQAEVAGLQPAAVVTERLRRQVAALRADAAAAEQLQEQVAALGPQAEQLPALKARYARMQASAAEVRQLESKLEQADKYEALKAQLQAQLEGLHDKVSEIEDLKRRVEEAQLQNTEAQQLEARLAAQQAVAARLPVLRTQKDKMEAEVAEVDQLEARLKELNEQVMTVNQLKQRINILMPKAAGVGVLENQLHELEAKIQASDVIQKQLTELRDVHTERRRDGTQFTYALSNLDLVPTAPHENILGVDEEEGEGEEGAAGLVSEDGGVIERSSLSLMRRAGAARYEQAPQQQPGIPGPPSRVGSAAPGATQYSAALKRLGLMNQLGRLHSQGGMAIPEPPVKTSPEKAGFPTPRAPSRMSASGTIPGLEQGYTARAAAGSGHSFTSAPVLQRTSPSISPAAPAPSSGKLTDVEAQLLAERERVAQLEELVSTVLAEGYKQEMDQLLKDRQVMVPPPPEELQVLRAEIASLDQAAAEALVLQQQAAEMRMLASQRQGLQQQVEQDLKNQLAQLDEQVQEAEALRQQIAEKNAVVDRKHELEMTLAELEATAAEVYLLEQLVEGRRVAVGRKPELEAELEALKADGDAAEALRLRVEEMTALVARRPELEVRQAELAVPAEGVEALLAEVAQLEELVAKRSELEARLEELREKVPVVKALEEQLVEAQELLGKEAVVAAELARIAYPAAEARSRKQELDELRALVASAPQLEKDIDEAEEEVARVRTLEVIVKQLRSEIARGPLLQDELRGLNETADRLQHAEEAQLRVDRDAARRRVVELEGVLASLEKQLQEVQARAPGPGQLLTPRGGAPASPMLSRIASMPVGVASPGAASGLGDGEDNEGEGLAALQSRIARGQQMMDQRMALQHELNELQVAEAEVLQLQAAIKALKPLAEQRAALQAELEEMHRQAGMAALSLAGGGPSGGFGSSSMGGGGGTFGGDVGGGLQPEDPMGLPDMFSMAPSEPAGFDGPLSRGAMGHAEGAYRGSMGGGVGRLAPEAPLPTDPSAVGSAGFEGDAIVALAQQRGMLAAEVEALRGQVAEVNALREEREMLRGVEEEVLALSAEIPHLAPYVELLPALRAEHARLSEAVKEAERLHGGVDSMKLQLGVLQALNRASGGGQGQGQGGAKEVAAEAGYGMLAPAGALEEGEQQGAEKAGDGQGSMAGLVEESLGAVFAKLRLLESSKEELEVENGELRATIDELRMQLEASAEAMQKLRGVAEALSMLRKGPAV